MGTGGKISVCSLNPFEKRRSEVLTLFEMDGCA